MASFLNTFGKYILMVVIAALSFLSGSVTDIGQAVQIAIDKDKAITTTRLNSSLKLRSSTRASPKC